MGKTIAGLRITLDGFADDSDNWSFDYANEEVMAALAADMAAMGTMVLGRKTYEMFAGFWPGQENPVADVMNSVPKVVLSSTLAKAEWQNSTLVSTGVAQFLTDLKTKSDKDIRVVGSLSVVRSLWADGLLDELQLFIYPLVRGRGERLFLDGLDEARMRVVKSETFSNGVLHVTYQRDNAGRE